MHAAEVPARHIAIAGATIAGTVIGAICVVLLWLHALQLPPGGAPVQAPLRPASAPMLQSAPQPELASYRAQKEQQLHGIGWVDRSQGIAHIPIEDAMALLAARAASAPGAPEAGR
jgi:hypothetical protein